MYMYTAKGLYLKNNPENNIKLKRFIEIWGGKSMFVSSEQYTTGVIYETAESHDRFRNI
jgi:hypothetical protein